MDRKDVVRRDITLIMVSGFVCAVTSKRYVHRALESQME